MKSPNLAFVLGLSLLTTLDCTLACSGGDGSNRIVLPDDAGSVTFSVDPASATKAVGQTQAFRAVATASDGVTKDVTDLAVWSSSKPSIATIDEATGVATGVSVGTVTITASRDKPNVAATATFTVTRASSGPDASVEPFPEAGTHPSMDARASSAPDTGPVNTPDASVRPDGGGSGPGTDAGSGPTTRLYVANLGGEGTPPSVRIFSIGATDDATPVAFLEGAKTTLLGPSEMAVSGNELYVANGEGRSILVFDVHANGNVAPLRTISGSNTTFSNYSPMGLVLHGGSIFVSDQSKGLFTFPLNGTGNIAPTPIGPSFIYAAHLSNSPVANEILVAVPSPSSEVRGYLDSATSTDAPLRVLAPGRTWARGVTSTPTGIFIVTAGLVGTTVDDAITVFAPDAKTNDAPLRAIVGLTNTGLADPHGISVHAGEIYVANQSEHAVRIFDAGATGDVAPKRVVKGASTGLKFPSGILVATTGG